MRDHEFISEDEMIEIDGRSLLLRLGVFYNDEESEPGETGVFIRVSEPDERLITDLKVTFNIVNHFDPVGVFGTVASIYGLCIASGTTGSVIKLGTKCRDEIKKNTGAVKLPEMYTCLKSKKSDIKADTAKALFDCLTKVKDVITGSP